MTIEPARRHGHSDPRYSATYFARFSPSARAPRAAGAETRTTPELLGWEDEGGALAPPGRRVR